MRIDLRWPALSGSPWADRLGLPGWTGLLLAAFAVAMAAWQLPRLHAERAAAQQRLAAVAADPLPASVAGKGSGGAVVLPGEAGLQAVVAAIWSAAEEQGVVFEHSQHVEQRQAGHAHAAVELRFDTTSGYRAARSWMNRVLATQPAVALSTFNASRRPDADTPRIRLSFIVFYRPEK